ncbi:MAG: ATP-binding cassette domain-containing protein [Anaerolineaceae bacterium]|nr:ATP-binding cassette domain-containing protein [Anaerolineaceae bacterium]
MNVIEVNQISKSFGSMKAVDGVSFGVAPGEIFGLLGPNGAGKTTTIRIILDIYKPDEGKVCVLGGEMSEGAKQRIGYLPEERGLYQDISLERCLLYLASLKGMPRTDARERLQEYLEQFDLAEHRKKKIKELSKGMQQKAQLIATLIHQPDLIIIDEPFTALDPVNTQMVKDIFRQERERGVTIVMCTHQMHQVEVLCDRTALINKGQLVLYGKLAEIRREYVSQAVIVSSPEALPADLPGVTAMEPQNGSTRLQLAECTSADQLLKALVTRGISLESFAVAAPSLEEIFIQIVNGEAE